MMGAGRELVQAEVFDAESPEVREALAFYADLSRVAEREGAQLLVVYFPLSYVIHPEDQGRWRHHGLQDVAAQMAVDGAFCAHLDALGTPCFNATEALLEAANSGERLYYWLDIHWTPEGNEVVARAVADHLLERRALGGAEVEADRRAVGGSE